MAGRFTVAGSVRLDSTGRGEVTVAPPGGGGGWLVSLVSVTTSTRVKEPTFKLYSDGVSPLNFLEGSYSGSQDSTDTTHVVQPGQTLVGVWEGGDVGAVATLRITGENG